ncbi:hypothetical protein AB1L30_18500 [Bremerella sp. JC817]|uniref:hypothetical protein n=1 Tax=Bremerella sp. JC817 TaxID=3231756 RepID=UPI0034596957
MISVQILRGWWAVGCWTAILFLCPSLASAQLLAPAEAWLRPDEVEFFQALGVDATVAGRPLQRSAKVESFGEIAERSEPPLKEHVQGIADAYQKMTVTPEEMQQYESLMKDVQEASKAAVGTAVLNAVLGGNDLDGAVEATNQMMNTRNRAVQEVWNLQTKWQTRGLAARQEADQHLAAILGNLETRAGEKRDAEELPLKLISTKGMIQLSGTIPETAADFDSPVVQVTMHKKQSGGQLLGATLTGNAIVRGLGVTGMDAQSQTEAAMLASATEESAKLPYVTTFVLDTASAGDSLRVNLLVPTIVASQLEKIEVKAWTPGGVVHIEEVPGLDNCEKAAEAEAKRQQKEEQLRQMRSQRARRR